jgi:GNAT superfamily N-acetyltransferase
VTATVRRLTAEEIDTDGFLALLGEAAGLDTDALIRIRDVELPTMTVVGTVDGSVLGFAAFGADTHGEDRTELHYIAVAHEARGTGLGSRLVDAARRADTTRPLYASTDDDAVDFYRRLGFVVADAPRDPRWPTRQRYDCLLDPLGTRPSSRSTPTAHARRYAQRTPATPSPLVAELAARLPVGSCVLELGSGPGRDADALEAAGLRSIARMPRHPSWPCSTTLVIAHGCSTCAMPTSADRTTGSSPAPSCCTWRDHDWAAC